MTGYRTQGGEQRGLDPKEERAVQMDLENSRDDKCAMEAGDTKTSAGDSEVLCRLGAPYIQPAMTMRF